MLSTTVEGRDRLWRDELVAARCTTCAGLIASPLAGQSQSSRKLVAGQRGSKTP